MPRAKSKPPVIEVEPAVGFRAQLSRYETLLKGIATVLATTVTIYGSLWAVGLAPMTNAKTAEVVEEKIQNHSTKFAQNIEKTFDQYDKRMKDVETSVKGLSDSASRVDERTRSIQEEQKSQRDLSNKILMELQKSNQQQNKLLK